MKSHLSESGGTSVAVLLGMVKASLVEVLQVFVGNLNQAASKYDTILCYCSLSAPSLLSWKESGRYHCWQPGIQITYLRGLQQRSCQLY